MIQRQNAPKIVMHQNLKSQKMLQNKKGLKIKRLQTHKFSKNKYISKFKYSQIKMTDIKRLICQNTKNAPNGARY